MPPNVVDNPVAEAPESVVVKNPETNGTKYPTPVTVDDNQESKLKIICASTLNLLAHIMIGATVMISLMYSYKDGLPIGPTPVHIVLCVLGYQLLMAEGILCLAPENSWTPKLSLRDKRHVHWVLQIVGSILGLVGSFIKIIDKNVHWNTLHGQFGLVSMVFTSISLVNGLASFYPSMLPRCMTTITKIGHICFGTVAFVTASVSLIYGFDKTSFRNWTTDAITDTTIAFTIIFTFITIVPPFFTMYRKSKALGS